jgi:hypothetical protein
MTEDIHQFLAELAAIKAESIGWIHLEENAYFHQGDDETAEEILVVGIPDVSMVALNVLLLG